MPLRPAENGRQVSLAMALSATQPSQEPSVNAASPPPASATSQRPARIMCIASPSAWAEEAQALDSENANPLTPNSMESWAAGALSMDFGMVSGCTEPVLRS